MRYLVQAQLKSDVAAEFLRKLLDGTIESQEPDGREIVASMNRAVATESGDIQWTETCYCPTPLEHERETVYDQYFDDLTTAEDDGRQRQSGRPFMTYLQDLANAP